MTQFLPSIATILKTKPVFFFSLKIFFLRQRRRNSRNVVKKKKQTKLRVRRIESRKMISGYQFIIKARSKRKLSTQKFSGINHLSPRRRPFSLVSLFFELGAVKSRNSRSNGNRLFHYMLKWTGNRIFPVPD